MVQQTKAQREIAFNKWMERQDSAKGRNAAKREAVNALKAAHIDEYNSLLQERMTANGVTAAASSSDDND